MKYGLNHPWKFRAFSTTYLVGLIQLIAAYFAEIISIAVLMSARSYIDAVKDFIALIVVNEFDDMLFGYLKDDNLHKLISTGELKVGSISLTLGDLFKIETTSAFKPETEYGDKLPSPELDPIFRGDTPYKGTGCGNAQNRPTSAVIKYKDRGCCNKYYYL